MRNHPLASEVRKRLLRSGFSRAYASRAARELQEHWEEIIDESLRNGVPQADAEREAATRLGSAEELAQEFSARMQRSSWLGRHPSLGFGLLALTLTLLWWVAFGSLAAQFCGIFSPESKRAAIKLDVLRACFDWIRATSYIAVPWLCCFVAERYFCGWRAALWACLVAAIHNAMHFMRISGGPIHGHVMWGYGFNFTSVPSLLAIVSPIAIFILYRAWALRSDRENNDSDLCMQKSFSQ